MGFVGTTTRGKRDEHPRVRARHQAESREPDVRAPGDVRATLLRYAAYLVALKLAVLAIYEALEHFGMQSLVREGSVLEGAQLVALLASSWLLFRSARARSSIVLSMLAVLPVAAALRELDYLFDVWIPVLTWKLPVGILALGAAFELRRRWSEVPADLGTLLRTRAWPLLFSSFVVVFVIGRLAGQQSVWRGALGDSYVYELGRAIEETIELAGYLLLFVGSLEVRYESGRAAERVTPDRRARDSERRALGALGR